jgi:hypothetical protein
MVHYKKTNVSIERHEWGLAGAVIINNAGYLVSERSIAENIGNGMVIDVIDDVEMRVANGEVVVIVVVKGFEEAGHHGVRDRGRDTDARPFWSGTSKPFTWLFHVAFGAGLGGMYLVMAFSESWGAPRRNPCQIAASKDDLGRLHRLWCINLTLFSFVMQ